MYPSRSLLNTAQFPVAAGHGHPHGPPGHEPPGKVAAAPSPANEVRPVTFSAEPREFLPA
jgi:hypothetical protein